MIIHLNSDQADKTESLSNDETRLTYYFKNPIILNDEHDLILKDFVVKKDLEIALLEHDNAVDTILNSHISRKILPRLINTNVIEESFTNIIIYEWDGTNFIATDVRVSVNTVQDANDPTIGNFVITDISDGGSGYVINNFLYLDKNDLTILNNSYNTRYGEIKINSLSQTDVVKTLTNYANNIMLEATANPINERTYTDIYLYKDDNQGWYIDSGVRATIEVVYPYSGANFANINILAITNRSSGLSLNQILYIDKLGLITNEPTMTYTTRFAEYEITETVDSVGSFVLSANVEILANEREDNIVGDLIFNNIPILISDGSGGYITTDASAKIAIIETPTNDNTGRANILEFSNGGTGFFVGDIIYIDKELLVAEYNKYDPNVRYAQYEITGITKDDGVIISAGNYGLSTYEIGNWYYDIPNKNTRVFIDVIDPPGFSISAYIKKVTGDRMNFLVNQTFNIQNNEMVNANTGQAVGFGKTGDPLQIQVANLTNTQYTTFTYEIYLENILYNTTKYFNSSNKSYPLILSNDIKNKNINLNNVVLSLTRQIIQEIKIIVNKEIQTSDNLILTLYLKKNNY